MGLIKRLKCRHDNLRGIYGDQINWSGGKRSQCVDCNAWFDDLPRKDQKELVKQFVDDLHEVADGNPAIVNLYNKWNGIFSRYNLRK